jgi:uncharacterized membrane protein
MIDDMQDSSQCDMNLEVIVLRCVYDRSFARPGALRDAVGKMSQFANTYSGLGNLTSQIWDKILKDNMINRAGSKLLLGMDALIILIVLGTNRKPLEGLHHNLYAYIMTSNTLHRSQIQMQNSLACYGSAS